MTALRMRARDFLSEDELVVVRERFTWKGAALIVHAGDPWKNKEFSIEMRAQILNKRGVERRILPG